MNPYETSEKGTGRASLRLRLFCGDPPRLQTDYPCLPKAVVRLAPSAPIGVTNTSQGYSTPMGALGALSERPWSDV